MIKELSTLYSNNPEAVFYTLLLSISFTAFYELCRFIRELVKSWINQRIQRDNFMHQEIYRKRLQYTEKIISHIEIAYHSINTNQNIEQVISILSSISKINIPRSTYFTREENIKIDEIIDKLKHQSTEFLNIKSIEGNIEELKKCLGIKFKK